GPCQSLAHSSQGNLACFGYRTCRYSPPDEHRRTRHQAGFPLFRHCMSALSGTCDPHLLRSFGYRAPRRDRRSTAMSLSQSAGDVDDLPPPAVTARWPRARIAGTVLLGLWCLLGAGVLLFLIASWDPDIFWRYAPNYLSGLLVTIELVATSVIAGAVLSIPIAAGRRSKNRYLSAFAYSYVYFFRGTPLLAQTFLIYYGLGSFRPELQALGLWGFFREAWYCAILAFTLNTAAYQAEILRGALESVGRGQ